MVLSQKVNVKLKIFISAYACEPNSGSEIGVGWNWVLQMSKFFEIWVLTRQSNQSVIEPWIDSHPEFNNINFIYFDLPYYLRFWKKGMRGVRIYYNIWQWCTNGIVKRTMQEQNINIFHHLTYGNALWSVSSYGKKQFFIWGPNGGTETISRDFTKYYQLKGRFIEAFRRIIVKTLPLNFGYVNRCNHANLILCKTDVHFKNISRKNREKAVLFTDVAVNTFSIEPKSQKVKNSIIKYIVVGKLDPWRGIDLAIEAFANAVEENKNIQLQIVGEGMDNKRLENLISRLDMNTHIKMLGKVSKAKYNNLMIEADVVLNTCLKEGGVTTAFDSMAMQKPLICIDTGGYTRYFTNDYAIVIPLKSRISVILELKLAILKLTNSYLRKKMGEKSKQIGQRFSWQSRGYEIFDVITNAYKSSL